MKKKNVAGLLALLFGIWGTHRFYLGQRFLGVLYITLFSLGVIATAASYEGIPYVLIPFLLGFIDAILFFVMPKEEFDERYNASRRYRYRNNSRPGARTDFERERYDYQREEKNAYGASAPARRTISPFKQKGIEKFRNYEFNEAVTNFKKALEYNYEDPATHFNLACCFSILQEPDEAFFHMEKSVEFGFTDVKRIHNHDALAFLRSLPEFEGFAKNNYRRIRQLSAPKTEEKLDLNEPQETLQGDLLEQIMQLGDLREKGILTEEEFSQQKRKILGK